MTGPAHHDIVCPEVATGGSASLVRLHVDVGDRLAGGQPICEIESDGARHVIRCSVPGRVVSLHVTPGAALAAGTLIVRLDPTRRVPPVAMLPMAPDGSMPTPMPAPEARRDWTPAPEQRQSNPFEAPALTPDAEPEPVAPVAPAGEPQYEFQPEEEAIIARAARRISIFGVLSLVLGLFGTGVLAACWYAGLMTTTLWMTALPIFVLQLATAWFYIRASKRLRLIVLSNQRDMEHLMEGMSALRSVFLIETSLLVVAALGTVMLTLLAMVM